MLALGMFLILYFWIAFKLYVQKCLLKKKTLLCIARITVQLGSVRKKIKFGFFLYFFVSCIRCLVCCPFSRFFLYSSYSQINSFLQNCHAFSLVFCWILWNFGWHGVRLKTERSGDFKNMKYKKKSSKTSLYYFFLRKQKEMLCIDSKRRLLNSTANKRYYIFLYKKTKCYQVMKKNVHEHFESEKKGVWNFFFPK